MRVGHNSVGEKNVHVAIRGPSLFIEWPRVRGLEMMHHVVKHGPEEVRAKTKVLFELLLRRENGNAVVLLQQTFNLWTIPRIRVDARPSDQNDASPRFLPKLLHQRDEGKVSTVAGPGRYHLELAFLIFRNLYWQLQGHHEDRGVDINGHTALELSNKRESLILVHLLHHRSFGPHDGPRLFVVIIGLNVVSLLSVQATVILNGHLLAGRDELSIPRVFLPRAEFSGRADNDVLVLNLCVKLDRYRFN
mmetsp:Transcript_73598/g.204528  ORF Transcript_73598/g.204528 Transcript_73598/m.204528 type:complete len:248 (-) Transcript_73598:318-1061(-)